MQDTFLVAATQRVTTDFFLRFNKKIRINLLAFFWINKCLKFGYYFNKKSKLVSVTLQLSEIYLH